ncbi:hypothetical protein PV325_002396 [Microctonus aethiopoides]|uniref:Uncharacterized protein n=1 Tax=Microctonus aethiopoides TaxID=144406 RepID=A0AA39KWM8_9HYME|nr:hypothetical protein PV325_002396 [Microctonus aethiopoides]KAK0083557.1 hypothetical protein PV326_006669 [Microctonus aethiopoides]KAK0176499.1 hypothetical protein PV328_000630 [Microctonus aethiopoides]
MAKWHRSSRRQTTLEPTAGSVGRQCDKRQAAHKRSSTGLLIREPCVTMYAYCCFLLHAAVADVVQTGGVISRLTIPHFRGHETSFNPQCKGQNDNSNMAI